MRVFLVVLLDPFLCCVAFCLPGPIFRYPGKSILGSVFFLFLV